MSFKENLIKKIEIDGLAHRVHQSIGPSDSGRNIDKNAMRDLLQFAGYDVRRERDLELYIQDLDGAMKRILVLDNELAVYHTTVRDVAMRKSPTVKEMLSIRNAIKILNDADVVVSKRDASVSTIHNECIDALDLSFDRSDLETIEKDGAAALENGFSEGVIECLSLFSELLGYQKVPKAFRIRHHEMMGKVSKPSTGELSVGPIVLYSRVHHTLKLVETPIRRSEKDNIERLQQIADGREDAAVEGAFVFEYLKKAVIRQNVWTLS